MSELDGYEFSVVDRGNRDVMVFHNGSSAPADNSLEFRQQFGARLLAILGRVPDENNMGYYGTQTGEVGIAMKEIKAKDVADMLRDHGADVVEPTAMQKLNRFPESRYFTEDLQPPGGRNRGETSRGR